MGTYYISMGAGATAGERYAAYQILLSDTPLCTRGIKSIYPSLGIRQLSGDVPIANNLTIN